MGKASKQNQKANSSSSSISSIEDKPIKKTKRTRKSVPRESPQQRSSIFRGVTRHRWTGRYEAHLWDKNCWNESQNKKGRQVYLGAYDEEEAAAHAYDLAALKYWGQDTILNFPLSTYQKEVKEMEEQTKEEYIGSLRRKSSGFSRGVSKYRGVARHHHNGRWEARIGRVFGNKYLYLGTYATQEEAATAYDMAAIEYRGVNAVTNFDLSRYIKWLRPNQIDNNNNNNNINVVIDNNLPQDLNSNPLEVDSMPNLSHQEIGSITSSSFLHQQRSTSSYESSVQPPPPPPPRPPLVPRPVSGANNSTALGLLLQSSKFKEMLERTSVDSSPSTPQESSSSVPPRRSFPDDIQTYFDCHDTINFADEHEGIFGDFASAMFPCELDT